MDSKDYSWACVSREEIKNRSDYDMVKKHLELLFWWFFRTLAQLNHLLGFSTIDKRKENNVDIFSIK